MRNGTTALALALTALTSAAAADISVAVGKVFQRPSVPKSLSGITYAGGNRFWTVADDGTGAEGGLYACTIDLGPEGTNVVSFSICSTNERVRLGTASDLEGCAFDPATGRVWATDEGGRNIREYDPATGEQVGGVHVPYILTTHPGNFGFEALSMRGDGLALWTANEEALVGDGDRSSHTAGTTVRLAKFSRPTIRDDFALEAMFPYTTDPWTYAKDYRGTARCGVAGLCALPDGSLLLLERELSFDDKTLFGIPYVFRLGWRVYRVERPGNATDVKDFESLKDGTTWKGVEKTLLAEGAGASNCEGICLGPRLADGRLSVLLVSDAGDGYSSALVQPLVLSGLDVATLDFPEPDSSLGADAAASIVGSNYRFLADTRVESALSGTAAAAARYAADGASVSVPQWSLASGAASGEGTVASFTVAGDDTLRWTGLSAARPVSTHVIGSDTFEEYEVGAAITGVRPGNSDLDGWSSSLLGNPGIVQAIVEAGSPAPVPAGFPLASAPHEKIFAVRNAWRYFGPTSGRNQKLEMLVRASDYFNILLTGYDPLGEDEERNEWIAMFHVEDTGTKPLLLHGDGNGSYFESELAVDPVVPGEWFRLGFLLDLTTDPNGRAFIEVSVNGTPVSSTNGLVSPSNPVPVTGGTWHCALPDTSLLGGITSLVLTGDKTDSFAVDDVLLAEAAFQTESAPGYVRADGVPSDWIRARGRDPVFEDLTAPTAIRDGDRVYSLGDAFTAGIDPDGAAPLRETAVELLPDGRVRIVLNGIRPDNADAYAVYGASDLAALSTDDPSLRVGGSFLPDPATGTTVWTSSAPAGDRAFFRVKASR